MRKVLVGSELATVVAALLFASPPRAAAAPLQLTVTSKVEDMTSTSGLFDPAFHPLVPTDTVKGPFPQDFTSYVQTNHTLAEATIANAGHFKSESTVRQNTTIVQQAESATITSDASMDFTSPVGSTFGNGFKLGNSGGQGRQAMRVTILANQSIAYSLTATSSVAPGISGLSKVQFMASDGTEGQSHAEIFAPGFGTTKTAASYTQSGRLELKSPASSVSVTIICLMQGGLGSASTQRATQHFAWHVSLQVGPASTDGDVYRWVQKKGGSYDVENNWDVKKVPSDDDATRNDTAVFDLPRKYTVNVGGAAASAADGRKDATFHRLERCIVKKGEPTFVISGDFAPDSQSESEPAVEVQGGAQLDVTGGRVTSQFALVGTSGGAAGVHIGFGARWENARTMLIGRSGGPGSLVIDDGGFVSSDVTKVSNAATTTVEVKDPNSKWQPGRLAIGLDGSAGTANVTVEQGASVETRQTDIGTGSGAASVSVIGGSLGVRSSWSAAGTPGKMNLSAFGGSGALVVDEGGDVSARQIFDGVGGPGAGNILVQGTETSGLRRRSSLVANEYAAIGFAHGATGLLRVERGGRFEDGGGMDVGLNGSVGLVTVTSFPNAPASLDVTGPLTLGVGPGGGTGSMEIGGADADVHVASDTDVGRVGEGRGRIAISSGADFTVVGTLRVAVGSVTLNGGTLNVLDMNIEPNGTLGGTGTVVVAGQVVADGEIAAGNSPGTLTIAGDLVVNAGGVVNAEVAGPDALADHLVVTGNATLNGTLVLHFMNGFAPKTGDHFEVLHVNGATTGDFATVDVQGLAPGAQFQIAQSGPGYVVTATNDATALPTVSAKAPKRAKERSRRPVFVTLTRSGKPTAALVVNYVLEGTAQDGVDYATLPGTVTFPAKKRSVKVPIQPIDDFTLEGDETVRVSVVPGVGSSRSLKPTAEIVIVDDER